MTGEVPPTRQCTLPSCEREAANPTQSGSLCPTHQDELDDDADDPYSHDHGNPIDVRDVTAGERAVMLREYLEAFVEQFGTVPRLMPLDEEGKAPIIQGRCKLDSPEGRSYLVDGEEAIRQIREEGTRGFAIYAGKRDHGTEDVALVDHDDDRFPTPTGEPTLEVLSGSGRGSHETYRNDPEDPVANARVGDNLGEIRAENWYCVTPGSVHPTGGVYHVVEERDIATLSDADLDDSMRPASRQDRERTAPDPVDFEGEGDRPDEVDIDARLERAFSNSHDGDRIEKVYNGRYAAAEFDDRSAAEFWLANRLDAWVGLGDRSTVRRLMDKANLQKWSERRDASYRDSILSEVGHQDWYATYGDEETDGGPYGRDHVSALPLAQLDAMDPHERRRAAKKRGESWPTTQGARDRLFATITEVMRNEDTAVVDAPTSLGKSHTVATTPWDAEMHAAATGVGQVVHLSKTRDPRDEAVTAAREAGVDFFRLRSRHEACAIAAGNHDPASDDEEDVPDVVVTMDGMPASEWLTMMCEERGVPFSAAHHKLEQGNDQEIGLPCCDEDHECLAISQWDALRECDDLDIVFATHNFAHVPGLRAGANIVLDEEPDFRADLTKDRVSRAVGAYLREVDAPVTTWESFIALSQYDGFGDDAANERDALRDALDTEPSRDWYFENPDAHTLAPALARAIFNAEERANGRRFGKTPHEPPRLDAQAHDDDLWNREWVSVVLDETNDIQAVRAVPDFQQARSVIGLDAHPARPKWMLNVHPHIQVKEVLDAEERRLWRRYERGLRVVQVGEATRPLASGEYFNEDKTRTFVEHLRETYGERVGTAITAAAVESQLANLMREAGVADPETMHYGEEKSRNDFANERIGFVNGSIDPGDGYVLDLLAELDLEAKPETHKTDDGETVRSHGRGFVGEDAGVAQEILASVRENHTAQAAGRYARNPDDPESHATVFVRTDAMPSGFADVQVPGVVTTFTEKQRAVIEALREAPGRVSAREIAAKTDVSKSHVTRTLAELADEWGVVDAFEGAGDYGATLYADTGAPNTGMVDLTADESPQPPYGDSYTWAAPISSPPSSSECEASDERGETESVSTQQVWKWRDQAVGNTDLPDSEGVSDP